MKHYQERGMPTHVFNMFIIYSCNKMILIWKPTQKMYMKLYLATVLLWTSTKVAVLAH